MANKSFKVITLGCKVNQYESAYLKDTLAGAGWQPAGKYETSDVVIINTCIVTQKANMLNHEDHEGTRRIIK